MSTVIWKWPLAVTDVQIIRVPKGAQILTAQAQGGTLNVWALSDTDAETEDRLIRVIGTGNPAPANPGKFIATVQLYGGGLVFHIFDGGPTWQGS